MSDYISKASVCDILADIYPTDGEKVVAVKEIDKAYDTILGLPYVESRPKGEWIEIKYRKPTEEEKERYPEAEEWFDCELPEHGEEVLVTTAYNNLIAMTTFGNYGEDGCVFEDYDAEDIIAWCRLPEPYTIGVRYVREGGNNE